MSIKIEVGKKLPVSPNYQSDQLARDFWRLSYYADRRYIRGKDANGQSVLVKHEREEDQSYQRRMRITKPRNYCGPILRRYNDFTFRKPPTRPDGAGNSQYQGLITDADGCGTTLNAFMRRLLLSAQVDREAYMLCDSSAEHDGGPISVAQAEQLKASPILRPIPASTVLCTDVDGGMLEECLTLCEEDGALFAMLYGEETVTRIELNQASRARVNSVIGMTVREIGEPVKHGYNGCPVVMLRPLFDVEGDCAQGDSQAGPLAEAQQSIVNQLSLLREEGYNAVYSQIVAFGVSSDQIGDIQMGNNRVLCIPNTSGRIETIGADPAQAESHRKDIADEEANLYRLAGVNFGATEGGAAESGVALAFRFNDLAANLGALATACEDAENLAMARIASGWGWPEVPKAHYSRDFDHPNMTAELGDLIRGLSQSSLPGIVRDKLISRFVDRNMPMGPEDQATLREQMKGMEAVKLAAASGSPFPPAKT